MGMGSVPIKSIFKRDLELISYKGSNPPTTSYKNTFSIKGNWWDWPPWLLYLILKQYMSKTTILPRNSLHIPWEEHSKIESNLLISIWNSLIVDCDLFCHQGQNVFPEKSNRSQNVSPFLVNSPVCTYRSPWQHFVFSLHGQVSHTTSQRWGPFWYLKKDFLGKGQEQCQW